MCEVSAGIQKIKRFLDKLSCLKDVVVVVAVRVGVSGTVSHVGDRLDTIGIASGVSSGVDTIVAQGGVAGGVGGANGNGADSSGGGVGSANRKSAESSDVVGSVPGWPETITSVVLLSGFLILFLSLHGDDGNGHSGQDDDGLYKVC